MSKKNEYVFEVLVIDPDGRSEIQSPKSLLHGLLSTDKLWSDAKDTKTDDSIIITDGDLNIRIKSSSILDGLIESAFLIKVKSGNFERIEKFRFPFLVHLRNRLNFSHIRLLTDDVSTHLSNQIYPIINDLENNLRRYISKFFTQKVGVDWWNKAVPDKILEKTKMRKGNETVFSSLLETDLTLIDFDDLGEIIYKHNLGFNKPQNLIDRILSISDDNTIIDIKKLQSDLDTNYNRFFKENFKIQGFETKWKQLFSLRNKVAHNNLFTQSDLDSAKNLHEELAIIISNAEAKIDEFRFSVEEQEAIRESFVEKTSNDEPAVAVPNGLKVGGKINLSKLDVKENVYEHFDIITENEFLTELERAEISVEKNPNMSYVGLKSFVTKILGAKGYGFGPTYSLANILREKGIVEIYEADDLTSYYPVKAIRKILKNDQ